MDAYAVDAVVIGAGVVGLAAARALALAGRDVVILEAEAAIGTHQSSRNSEVIHAGLYYRPGSVKAATCLAGKALLYAYGAERGIAHRALGKLVVATAPDQVARLEAIAANARACGLEDLALLDAAQARAREPALSAVAALWSPSSGIVDSHGLMVALLGDVEDRGGSLALGAPVLAGEAAADGIRLTVGGSSPAVLAARTVVIAAGLHAPALARRIAGVRPETIPTPGFAKGTYYNLSGRAPFRHLIYPVPEPGGLGVHLTLDLAGQARFGPDVEWVETLDYSPRDTRRAHFEREVRAYWPGLPEGALAASYCGVRAKIGPREAVQDFTLHGPETHGLPGLLCLYGIESPGLTACLALAERIAARVAAMG